MPALAYFSKFGIDSTVRLSCAKLASFLASSWPACFKTSNKSVVFKFFLTRSKISKLSVFKFGSGESKPKNKIFVFGISSFLPAPPPLDFSNNPYLSVQTYVDRWRCDHVVLLHKSFHTSLFGLPSVPIFNTWFTPTLCS